MKVSFLGAIDGHVTGSCTHFLFERSNIQFLVDCGLRQGEGPYGLTNGDPFPFEPTEIDFVLLTHAHQDHCGLLPKLYRDGFAGEVICTSATADLAMVNLKDSLKHVDGLFSEENVHQVRFSHIDERSDFGFSRLLPIHDHLFVAFTRSSHILGACSIVLGWQERGQERRHLVMSGDLGNNTKLNPYLPLLAGRQGIFAYPDYIVIESTYGAGARETHYSSFDDRIMKLRSILEATAHQDGVLLIPAFSLHRTQEILVDLYALLVSASEVTDGSGVDVIVDSRLACAMTKVYRRKLGERQGWNPNDTLYRNRLLAERLGVESESAVDELLDDLFDTSHIKDKPLRIGSHTISYQVNFSLSTTIPASSSRATVLLTGGGMCEGGPVVEHLKLCVAGYHRPVNLLITGYMANDSLGARLVEAIINRDAGNKQSIQLLDIGGINIPVSEIKMGLHLLQGYYSGHADQEGLLDFIFTVTKTSPSIPVKPVSVFINHGKHGARQALQSAIQAHKTKEGERHVKDVYLPDSSAWFDLDTGNWIEPKEVSGLEHLLQAILAEQRKTNALFKQLIGLQAAQKNHPKKKT